MTDQWCILRCKNVNTLPLVRSLTRAGITVWSPIETVTRRVPRANVKRRLDSPLMPSYIFAAAEHLAELVAIHEQPVSQHRDFRIQYWHGRLPLIADSTLAPLRNLEARNRLRQKRDDGRGRRLAKGARVTLSDGPFAGMHGDVVASGGAYTTVRIQGFSLPLKIANYHLLQGETDFVKHAAA